MTDAPLTASGRQLTLSSKSVGGALATFSDAVPNGVVGDYTANIKWGDGTAGTATVAASGTAFTVSGSHHCESSKPETITITISSRALDLINQKAGQPADEVAAYFLNFWREVLTRSHLEAGCAVLAVAVAADSPDLLGHAAEIFRTWLRRLAELLEQGGLKPGDAARIATVLIASSEGAMVLSRAEQSMEPFDLVAEQLLAQVRALAAS